MHEDLSRGQQMVLSSSRTFGVVWTVMLLLYGLAPLRHSGRPRLWAITLAAVLLIVAIAVPSLLDWPNRMWAKLALLLHRIVSPVAMALLFYICFVPAAIISRWRGQDALRLKFAPEASTYWIERNPPGPPAGSMIHQF